MPDPEPSGPAPLRSIHVVAGVITDARGRILLTRRTEGRDLAGLWEFPGGKREPGETSEAALIRELQEELGIHVDVGAPVIEVPQRYPDKRLRLDVRHVRAWKGSPRGHEGQAMAWVAPDKLPRYDMPPADRPVVAALLRPDRYLVTPAPGNSDEAWLAGLSTALAAGIRLVQLRAGDATAGTRWRDLVTEAVRRCRAAGAQVLINGDAELASELGAGLHLRSQQLLQATERPLSAEHLVAASCHDADELRQAERIGCSFAVLGPVRATATHPGTQPLGWERFALLRESVSLPLYAIGGLAPHDLTEARRHGAQGVAAIRAFWPL